MDIEFPEFDHCTVTMGENISVSMKYTTVLRDVTYASYFEIGKSICEHICINAHKEWSSRCSKMSANWYMVYRSSLYDYYYNFSVSLKFFKVKGEMSKRKWAVKMIILKTWSH